MCDYRVYAEIANDALEAAGAGHIYIFTRYLADQCKSYF
jgi:hypothetical protein